MVEQVKCGQCALWQPKGQTCRLHKGLARTPDNSCPEGTTYLEKCDICGGEILPKQVIIDMGLDHKMHLICPDCSRKYYSCSICGQATQCSFETSSIDLPKQIQKQIQTPQGYIVTTIMNPDRIRETCEKGCKCFDKENGCSRQSNYCSNHSIAWKV